MDNASDETLNSETFPLSLEVVQLATGLVMRLCGTGEEISDYIFETGTCTQVDVEVKFSGPNGLLKVTPVNGQTMTYVPDATRIVYFTMISSGDYELTASMDTSSASAPKLRPPTTKIYARPRSIAPKSTAHEV